MKYKVGDILRGKVNGREFKITEREADYYVYKDLKTKKQFMVDRKTLEQCAVEKVNQ